MKQYNIKTKATEESIPISIAVNPSKKIILFINGDRDTKESFYPVINNINNIQEVSHSLACFSFRGRETGREYPREQAVQDLKDVFDFLIMSGYEELVLVPTSSGFISTTFILVDSKYSQYINTTIMLDPTDYPIDGPGGTWTGSDNFSPESKLISSKLTAIKTPMVIHLVFFSLRNFDPENKPRTNIERGVDNPKFYTRLHQKMTENIFHCIPKKYRGEFIVDKRLPHNFSSHGDIKRNQNDIANYVKKFVGIAKLHSPLI